MWNLKNVKLENTYMTHCVVWGDANDIKMKELDGSIPHHEIAAFVVGGAADGVIEFLQYTPPFAKLDISPTIF
ncbi:hypothetical protein CRG98_033472 [Punica granatum]|uniref:Uncharacterized protein n=1 Tax=Punica granatum TaxID=22663 RepID=A0A2I0IQ81_PUNGR|nr:hypothetical protein CRG98_033472 [Punica granatum]